MTTATLMLDGMRVPVEYDETSRRARLTIEADGSLRLRAARDLAHEELQRFLVSKRQWIYTKLAEKEELRQPPVTKELVDGEGFLYLGRSHRLLLVPEAGRVRLHRGRLEIPRTAAALGPQPLLDWYARAGLAWIQPRLRDWAVRLRVDPGKLEVGELGARWGSATADGRVRVHWATMQLRPHLIDYVIAHELAHLREPHHGAAFWQVLGRALPDYDERKLELATSGSLLWFGSVQ